MKKQTFIFALLFTMLTVSCGGNKELQSALRSDDPEQRLVMANEFYDKADFYKAIQLYEVVINENILVKDLAEVYFRYANSHYAQDDFLTASNLFNLFYATYPDNINAEAAYYYKAQCSYEMAETDFRLDQSNLELAMKEFGDYLITYPEGEWSEDAQRKMDEIVLIRERKKLEKGKLYLQIGEYKAAIEEFNRFIEDEPDSELVETAYYNMLEARFLLAKLSIESKQKERYKKVINEYQYFTDKYETSLFGEQAKDLFEQAQNEYNKLNDDNEQANN